MTPQQIASVDALKIESAEFTIMRELAMRFHGLLMGGAIESSTFGCRMRSYQASTPPSASREPRGWTSTLSETRCWDPGAMGRPRARTIN